NTIVNACSLHPNLIQWVCKQIIELLDRSDQAIHPEVTQELVTRVISQPQFAERYIEVFWGQSTPLEKAITLLIGDIIVEPAHIASLLQERGFKVSQEQLTTALNYLALYCVIQRDNECK